MKRKTGLMAAVVLGTVMSSVGVAQPTIPTQAVNELSRYCAACWRNARLPADVWPDCTQEVFVRLLERLPSEAWGAALQQDSDERRELVRAIDAVKKRVQRRRVPSSLSVDPADWRGESSDQQDDLDLVREAAESLTDRQRNILAWSAEGWSVRDIADKLNVDPTRVSDEKYKAIQKLRKSLIGGESITA